MYQCKNFFKHLLTRNHLSELKLMSKLRSFLPSYFTSSYFLVPFQKAIISLTYEQMYVPGQLSDVDNVLIDIGTGYFVEMVSS